MASRAAGSEREPEPDAGAAEPGAQTSAPATLDSTTSGDQSAANRVETLEEERLTAEAASEPPPPLVWAPA
eukprot:15459235-Alexandrium_andersonii.AAC.1